MEFKIVNNIEHKDKYDLEIIPCFSKEDSPIYGDILNKLKEKKLFEGEKGTRYILNKENDSCFSTLMFLGFGERKNLTYESLYKIFVSESKHILSRSSNILIHGFSSDKLSSYNILKAIILSLKSSNYTFDKYMTSKKDKKSFEIDIFMKDIDFNINEIIDISDALYLTRDLVNEPANILTPEELANRCKESLMNSNVDVEVYDEKWIKDNNLNALYSVGKASSNKPRFIVMKYFGDKDSDKTISFVGKGLTYDSGGYSIKSSDGMVTMKCDMAGAASVLSLMTLISKQNLKLNVYGIIPACENMINGDGFKPGDIINSLAGKTIEIISTDAEGRLALADGVYYAAKNLNTDLIIDIATLTGACGIALGTKYAAIVDNNEKIFEKLREASFNTVDSVWRLPADKEYLETLKSNVADLKNIGGRYGGTITAGLFVGEFVDNKPWAHIDIAYVAWNDFASKIFPKKGGTGAIVELLYRFCKDNQNI